MITKKFNATKDLYQEQSGKEAYLGAARHAELYARTAAGTDFALAL